MSDISDEKRGIGPVTKALNRSATVSKASDAMADISQSERQTSTQSRGTANKQLNSSSSTRGSSPEASKAGQGSRVKPALSEQALAAEREKQEKDQRKDIELGIIEDRNYEFKDAKGKSSWVKVGKDKATFVDTMGKSFLTLSYGSLREVLDTTGDNLQEAPDKYKSSELYRQAQVRKYYHTFRPGNKLARNEFGSGQFRYEISEQHLASSVSNELEHVSQMIGWDSAERFFNQFADKNPGMECWGTTMQNVLKARGMVPPTITREEFEKTYASILNSLTEDQRKAMFGGLKPLARLGKYGTKTTLETLVSKFSRLEWAQFTGMNAKKANVRVLNTAKEVEEAVGKGYAVFVGVPGHYKSAVGGSSDSFIYDDPLGCWGHILYDNKPVRFGVVIE
jgi:hypothetical protein